jgi:hypothetical protein
MVDYGEHFDDEAPTSTHIRRRERKYRYHKLSRALGDQRFKRNHGGEAVS